MRLVSSTFHTDVNVPSPRLTQFFTIFAQFVDHDLTLTATYVQPNCCNNIAETDECAPIIVGQDPVFSRGFCLNFVRSMVFCEELGCNTDPMNVLTAYIDGSQIYGSDIGNASSIRQFSGGQMATSFKSLLPIVNGNFKAGETRALENPALGSMHTIWVREHNRVAAEIQSKVIN